MLLLLLACTASTEDSANWVGGNPTDDPDYWTAFEGTYAGAFQLSIARDDEGVAEKCSGTMTMDFVDEVATGTFSCPFSASTSFYGYEANGSLWGSMRDEDIADDGTNGGLQLPWLTATALVVLTGQGDSVWLGGSIVPELCALEGAGEVYCAADWGGSR